MTTKSKTAVLFSLTFITGLVLGGLIHSLFIAKTVNRMSHKFRSPDFFVERFDALLQPTPEQRIQIDKILRKHHREMMRLHELVPARFDSLKKELDAVLTDEQRSKLEKQFENMNRKPKMRPPHHMNDHKPGPPGEPPPPPPPGEPI